MKERTTPRNRNEQEIAEYKDVLNIIHYSFDAITISKNYILQMHKIMFSQTRKRFVKYLFIFMDAFSIGYFNFWAKKNSKPIIYRFLKIFFIIYSTFRKYKL